MKEDDDSSESDESDGRSYKTPPSTKVSRSVGDGGLEESVQEAANILSKHEEFLETQKRLVEDQCRKNLPMPTHISSKRPVEIHAETLSSTINRGLSQREKNRKRKLKKKRAKEKLFKKKRSV